MRTRKASPVLDRLAVQGLGALVRVLARRGSILCFHGLRRDDDPIDSVMNLTLSSFKRAIDLVQSSGQVVPLTELLRRWTQGKSTRGLVAITFDDAYASLLETAAEWYTPAPFPVTIFVVAGASFSGTPFWWDRLEALASAITPEDATAVAEACGLPAGHGGTAGAVPTQLAAVRDGLLELHAGRAPAALNEELTRLEQEYARNTTQRPMRVHELKRMSILGPVTFGVHTLTHPALPRLSDAQMDNEIRGGWAALEEWGPEARLPILAAPFGMIDERVNAVARRCGMGGVLGLDDQVLGFHAGSPEPERAVSRLSIVEATAPVRLAYRLSGIRDVVKGSRAATVPIETEPS